MVLLSFFSNISFTRSNLVWFHVTLYYDVKEECIVTQSKSQVSSLQLNLLGKDEMDRGFLEKTKWIIAFWNRQNGSYLFGTHKTYKMDPTHASVFPCNWDFLPLKLPHKHIILLV